MIFFADTGRTNAVFAGFVAGTDESAFAAIVVIVLEIFAAGIEFVFRSAIRITFVAYKCPLVLIVCKSAVIAMGKAIRLALAFHAACTAVHGILFGSAFHFAVRRTKHLGILTLCLGTFVSLSRGRT